jgi:KDO2-lipid IV(A) lauroyltransferase
MPRRLARAFAWARTRWIILCGGFGAVEGIVAENLAPVVAPGVEARSVARRCLRMYGTYIMDYFRIPAMKPHWLPKMFRPMVGQENVVAALKGGRGAVLVSPHLGNWELGGVALALMGNPITVVGVPDALMPGISRFRDHARRVHGIEVINVEAGAISPLELARALERNRLVAMLGDRNFFEADAVEVDFFGRKARFPRGPALLAIAMGSPLLPCFVTYGAKGKYDAEVTAPIPAPSAGPKGERASEMTQALAKVFEERIRAHPEQWYVFDPYWSGGTPITNVGRTMAGLADEGSASPLK